jgi:Type IV secretion system pilin
MLTIIHILANTSITDNYLPRAAASPSTFGTVLTLVGGIIGALSLLMITVSGLRYVLSAGDPQKITRAKNGIIYSLVGIAVAVAAESIVAFVVNRL